MIQTLRDHYIVEGLYALKEKIYRKRTSTWLFMDFSDADLGGLNIDKMNKFKANLEREEQEIQKLIDEMEKDNV